MATTIEVLGYLIPNGGWVLRGNEYKDIEFIEATPITEAQFNAGFQQYDNWKADKDAAEAAARAAAEAKLAALGLTAEDLKALGL